MSDKPPVVFSDADKIAFKQFKKNIHHRTAWDIKDEPAYNKDFKSWDVHRMDDKHVVVIDTYHFSKEEVAKEVIEHAKNMRL